MKRGVIMMSSKHWFIESNENDYKYSIESIIDKMEYNLNTLNEIINSIFISNNIDAPDFIGMMQLALAVKYMCNHLINRDDVDNKLKESIKDILLKTNDLLNIEYDPYLNDDELNIINKIEEIIDDNNLVTQ